MINDCFLKLYELFFMSVSIMRNLVLYFVEMKVRVEFQ